MNDAAPEHTPPNPPVPHDLGIIGDMIATMEARLPVPSTSHLAEHVAVLMERSAGCVGILHEWRLKAMVIAMSRRSSRLTLADLLAACPSASQAATPPKRTDPRKPKSSDPAHEAPSDD